ncbi:hypothetical protein GGI07_002135 [Coemansia sp. Benny D115]|nr:hypothetical protein GGI07_002135 [Coemansia sp. Benny D115]
MGISSIFKRSKTSLQASEQSLQDYTAREPQRPRHIKRRPTASSGSNSESGHQQQQQRQQKAADSQRNSKPARSTPGSTGTYKPGKKTARVPSFGSSSSSSSSSEDGDLPTPEKSIDETYGSYRSRSNKRAEPPSAVRTRFEASTSSGSASNPRVKQAENDMFGLFRLTTPPLESAAPQPADLDPFEDSPPLRSFSNFEDPVYIPPPTLVATLFDDYGAVGEVLERTSTSRPSNSAPARGGAAHTSSTAAGSRAAPAAGNAQTAGSGSLDFLSEFNATYSYLFGSLPSESVTPGHASAADADSYGVAGVSGRGSKKQHETAAANGGLLSPSSTGAGEKLNKKAEAEGSDNGNGGESDSDGDDASSSGDSDGNADDATAERELEEERRKEEDRKAAELRNRRREQIKQQVAFERMKERHRRQYPGQPPAGTASGGVARWQKESVAAAAAAVAASPGNGAAVNASLYGQNALYSSNATINRSHAQGTGPQASGGNQGIVAASGASGGIYSNMHINASMPNIGYTSDPHFGAGNLSAQFPSMQKPPALHVDTSAAMRAAGVNGHLYNGYNSLPLSAQVPGTNYHASPQQNSFTHIQQQMQMQMHLQMQKQQQQQQIQAVAENPMHQAHPVKLAPASKTPRNPYLSDASDSDDNASDMSSELDSDISSIGSSDISLDQPLSEATATFEVPVPQTPEPQPVVLPRSSMAGTRVSRSMSQPALKINSGSDARAGESDASSDTSAKSQSSSRRRVRFHETVSVVINTRNSVNEDDLEQGTYDSENDSSNASIDFQPGVDNESTTSARSSAASGMGTRGYSQDEAFDSGNGYSTSRYQLPSAFATSSIAGVQWYDGDSTTVTNSKDSSGVSSRNISPDGTRSRKQRPPKHRIVTQPLRDREAEREQQKLKHARKAESGSSPTESVSGAKQVAGIRSPATPPKASSSSSPSVSESPTATEGTSTPPIDPVAEARRALLGHYNVPNPEMPIGKNIPRSSAVNKQAPVVRTSSVKVIQPPSFARAKPKSKSKSSSTSYSRKSFSDRYQAKAATSEPADAHKESSAQPAAASQARGGNNAALNFDDSREFNFSNVLQNYSIASFDVTKDSDGGVRIRYSDHNTTANNDSASSSSDEDDVPLSSIARSKSEPGVHPPRHSADNHLVLLSADGGDRTRSYDSDNAGNAPDAATKISRRFFGKNQPRIPAPQTAAKTAHARAPNSSPSAKTDGPVPKTEGMRSLSMDAGSRQLAGPLDGGKRRFGRWGTFF